MTDDDTESNTAPKWLLGLMQEIVEDLGTDEEATVILGKVNYFVQSDININSARAPIVAGMLFDREKGVGAILNKCWNNENFSREVGISKTTMESILETAMRVLADDGGSEPALINDMHKSQKEMIEKIIKTVENVIKRGVFGSGNSLRSFKGVEHISQSKMAIQKGALQALTALSWAFSDDDIAASEVYRNIRLAYAKTKLLSADEISSYTAGHIQTHLLASA